jgi:hypothetical protein
MIKNEEYRSIIFLMRRIKVRIKKGQNLIKHYNYNDNDGDDDDDDSCNSKVNAAYLHYVFLCNIIPMRDSGLPSQIM